jgi:hypothetical protein
MGLRMTVVVAVVVSGMGYWSDQVKGYHSDRVTQTFDTVTSRRNLIRAALIGLPALALASASASARQDSAPAKDAASAPDGAPFDGHVDVGGPGSGGA